MSPPTKFGENDFPLVLVLIAVMLAIASDRHIPSSEVDLATGAEADASERFVRLADVELDRAYRLAGLILGDRHEAEDATQDALLRAWRSADVLREPANFRAWFDRILVNVCRDRLRRRGKVRAIPMDDAVLLPSDRDPFRSIVDRDLVLRAMASLPDELRIVIVLHYWADLTLDGVAQRLGCPVGTAKSRLHRALAEIRSRMDATAIVELGR